MNNRRRIFIFAVLFITAISTFIYAKSHARSGYSVIYAARGSISADRHNPMQGRLLLRQVNDTLTHFSPSGKASKIAVRPFLAKWPKTAVEGALTFTRDELDTHFLTTLSHPYYDPGENVMTFEMVADSDLSRYDDIHEVTVYVY
ncbi:MAG: hypothetical protein H7A36_03060 [Chlamydiales bacterium]|nr:hypothetical protein [Chlamydiales bacterium]